MTVLVQRFSQALNAHQLPRAIEAGGFRTEELPSKIPLNDLRDRIDAVLNRRLEGSGLDRELVEPVHASLKNLSRREAADMRVWHWLCVTQFPDLVVRRWDMDGVPSTHLGLTSSVVDRFLGKATLVGVGRNTLARLWWTAEELQDYDMARTVLSNQEDFVAIFERRFGLYPPAARAAVAKFALPELSDPRQREAAKWLQQTSVTTVLEALQESEVGEILEESINATR